MKRVIAFLAALAMTAAVGCGEVEKDEPSAKMGIETSASEKTSEVAEDGGESASEGMVNDGNCIIQEGYQDEGDDAYDNEVLYKMTELAAEQYNAIIDRDKQAYFDTLNIRSLLSDKGSERLYKQFVYSDDSIGECELEVYFRALFSLYDPDREELTKIEDTMCNSGLTADEAAAKCRERISAAANELTADDAARLYGTDTPFGVLFGENAAELPKGFSDDPSAFRIVPDDGTIFCIEPDEYRSNEYGTFAELDLYVVSGDWGYLFSECLVWISGDNTSVYIGDISIEENEFKGMSIDELRDELEDDYDVTAANMNAKVAYNCAAEYFADAYTKGRDLDTVIADGDFMAAAENGLDFKKDNEQTSALGKGDEELLSAYDFEGIASGTVYLGVTESDGKRMFFIQFLDENGVIGQYPEPIKIEDIGKVSWKEFYDGSSE
ncbi:MAG: hypothetical protein IIZ73_00960 [Ruminococcus sp.]|nr:hypothetical protein [Ruminococcus sp.]